MQKKVKILIFSNLHLGIKGDAALVPERIRAVALKKIITLAKKHDILLIGGDLFDNSKPDPAVIAFVREEFKKLVNYGVEIVYTPGAGELDEDGSVADFVHTVNATHVYADTENIAPYAFSRDEQSIYVYGIPSADEYDISTIGKVSDEGFHIGLFYAEIEQNAAPRTNPYTAHTLKKKAIKSLPLDFYAFGYNHNFKILKMQEKIIGAISGSPEAVSRDETGDRYVISLEIKNSEIVQIKRIKVNSITIAETAIDCSGIDSLEPVINSLEFQKSSKVILGLTLTGERNFIFSMDDLENFQKEFYSLTIQDRSSPTLHALIEKFREENTLRGEFYRILREKIEKNEIPAGVDWKNLAGALHGLSGDIKKFTEEWLCTLKNA